LILKMETARPQPWFKGQPTRVKELRIELEEPTVGGAKIGWLVAGTAAGPKAVV
jgi:hypothetical protein